MDMKKQAICEALRAWINQRPGLEAANYFGSGNYAENLRNYRAEVRSIGKDLQHARELLRAVELRDSITGNDLEAAFPRAYSGRLSCRLVQTSLLPAQYTASMDYCAGQYWPTEYRKAACAVLASVLWNRKRADMPKPRGKLANDHDDIEGMTPGDWLRASFRREYGRSIADRWFA